MTDNRDNQVNGPDDNGRGESGGAEQQWVGKKLSQHLDARVDELDFTVTARLAASRQNALAQLEQSDNRFLGSNTRGFPWIPHWQAGVAAMAIVGVIGFQFLSNQTPTHENVEAPELVELDTSSRLIEDMQMLSASDDLEFFQNLEFLEWLDNDAV